MNRIPFGILSGKGWSGTAALFSDLLSLLLHAQRE
jgi:hypothetical protein